MIDIDNTASSWFDFLTQLSEEAKRDSETLDPRFALHGILADLSNVAAAYAGRLETEQRQDLSRPVDGADPLLVTEPAPVAPAAEPVSPSETSDRPVETTFTGDQPMDASPQVLPPTEAAIPGWLLDALADMARRIEELEARVTQLEQKPRDYVSVKDPYQLDLIDVIDEDRTAWNSVDRARAALRGMIMREHRRLSASRQAILSRLAALALDPDRDGLVGAELRQHRDRAQELASIDAIMGVKLDEIAGNDDLLALREYDPLKGWPV